MASTKELRTQIASIQSTQKITSAMEMVAASKMRRAQERMHASRPYAEKIRAVIHHLALAHPEYKHPFMQKQDHIQRVGLVIISSDRGLCGGLNTNLFRKLAKLMGEWEAKGLEIDVALFGGKAVSFFKRLKVNVVAELSDIGDAPEHDVMLGNIKVMLDAYAEGKIGKLCIASNQFVSAMTQNPTVETLLPLDPGDNDDDIKYYWDYLYEPEAEVVLDTLLTRYIESLVYQGVVENKACEMAARMVAMKAATDNAGELISELKLVYNKARQAAITQEISEIVSGAAAVE